MKLGELDIIGHGGEELLYLRFKETGGSATVDVALDAERTEHLITYLKGLRDGLGWNKKAAADRSL